MNTSFEHFIDGGWAPIKPGKAVDLYDPTTEEFCCSVPVGSASAVNNAVKAARNAFDGNWNTSALPERLVILERLIEQIEDKREAFAQTISKEIGAPIDFSRKHQVEAALDHLRSTHAAAQKPENRFDARLSVDAPTHRVRYEAIGVAVLITPWNWPLNQIALKVGAALLSGCTMVLKPSELASQTGILFAKCIEPAGVSAGVFNLVIGNDETGKHLTSHPDVDVISFTGSTRAGRSVALAAAEGFKRTTLELGGKSPNLLFDDCDLPLAVEQGIAHCFRNSGQSCNAASRMLVQEGIYDKALAFAVQFANEYKNNPRDTAENLMGPLVNRAQFDRAQSLIQKGVDEGARLLTGGLGRPNGFERGFFIRPTVFADVTQDMSIAREEIFGPVLTISKFTNMNDAIQQANDSAYGLAAYVQTSSNQIADEAACRLNAGMVQVNGTSRVSGAPFGGVKASGQGREAGIWGIRAFQDVKSISGASHQR